MDADDPRFPSDDPSDSASPAERLPLLTVEEAVCFPGTRMEVPVTDRGALRLLQELMQRPEEERWAGVVLPMPGGEADPFGRPEVFPGGTVARVVDVFHPALKEMDDEEEVPLDEISIESTGSERLDRLMEMDDEEFEARAEEEIRAELLEAISKSPPRVILAGEYRFEVARQIPSARPFREVVARRLAEDPVDEGDPAVVRLRQRILELAAHVLPELDGMVAYDADTLVQLRTGDHRFEQVVNRLAAGLDLPPSRKLELLLSNLPERGHALASILENRRYVLDQLRPWRHLASDPELN